jgi:hypothetical protein
MMINFRCDRNIWDRHMFTSIYVAADIMLSVKPTTVH